MHVGNGAYFPGKKFFGYYSILAAFFFEQVPTLNPKVRLPPAPLCELRITLWGDVFLRQGGGEIQGSFDDGFYAWWGRQVLTFE